MQNVTPVSSRPRVRLHGPDLRPATSDAEHTRDRAQWRRDAPGQRCMYQFEAFVEIVHHQLHLTQFLGHDRAIEFAIQDQVLGAHLPGRGKQAPVLATQVVDLEELKTQPRDLIRRRQRDAGISRARDPRRYRARRGFAVHRISLVWMSHVQFLH